MFETLHGLVNAYFQIVLSCNHVISYIFYGGKIMYEKKFDMTQEENIFWAKRNLVDYI